jgi:high-affinity Fe2+/Pb2+ permease
MGIVSLIISIIALFVSAAFAMWGWWRHRNVYDIERALFFRKNQIDKINNNEALRKKLDSGHYTILHTGEYGGYIELILGKIKK